MRQVTFLLVLISTTLFGQSKKTTQLELTEVFQLTRIDDRQFDLSGIVEVGDQIFIIADKSWNKYIYEIEFNDSSFFIQSKILLNIKDDIDLEAIDYYDSQFYLANERTGGIYTLPNDKSTCIKLPLDLGAIGSDIDQWKNAGWEGMAFDAESRKLYLVKERGPRRVFAVDLKTNKIIDDFNIPETESNDFSDAKFKDGYLYLLERNGNYVSKINPKTKQVVAKVTYKHITSHTDGKLYVDEKYGMGEGLLIRENEIWIALDNNGHQVSNHAINTYNMKGEMPVILKFKRPKDF